MVGLEVVFSILFLLLPYGIIAQREARQLVITSDSSTVVAGIITVRKNGILLLNCTNPVSPKDELVWVLNRLNGITKENNNNLKVDNVIEADAGTYTCKSENNTEIVPESVDVVIIDAMISEVYIALIVLGAVVVAVIITIFASPNVRYSIWNSISKCTNWIHRKMTNCMIYCCYCIDCRYCCRDPQIMVEEGFAHELRRSSKKNASAVRQSQPLRTNGSLRSNKTKPGSQRLKKTCQQCEALNNAQKTVNKNGRQSERLNKTCQKCTNLKNMPTQKQSLDKNSTIRQSQRSKKCHESLRRKQNISGQQIQATQNTAQKSKTLTGPQPPIGISIGRRSQNAKNMPTENRPQTRNKTSLGPQKSLTRPQSQASNRSATREQYQTPKKSVNGQNLRNSLGGPKSLNLIGGTRRQTRMPSKTSSQDQISNNVSTVQQPQKESILGQLFQSAKKMVSEEQAQTSIRQQSLQTKTGQQPPPRTARHQATTPKKPTTRPPPNRTEKKTAAGRTSNSQKKMTAQQGTQPRKKNSTGRTQVSKNQVREKIDERMKTNENGYNSTDDLSNDQNEVSELEDKEEFDEEGDLEDENGNEENDYESDETKEVSDEGQELDDDENEEEPEVGEPDEYDNEGFIEDEENSDLQEEEVNDEYHDENEEVDEDENFEEDGEPEFDEDANEENYEEDEEQEFDEDANEENFEDGAGTETEDEENDDGNEESDEEEV